MALRKRITVIASLLVVILLASVSAYAAPLRQTPQELRIGVIGAFDSPTAQGVSLAVERINARGPVNGPGNTTYSLSVITAEATTAEDVGSAINQLKQNNAVAIFGPDDSPTLLASSEALRGSGLPVFTAATTTEFKGSGNLFRTRASNDRQMAALADVLITDLKKNKFAIFQGDPSIADQVGQMVTALTQKGKPPAPPVLQVANGAVADSANVLLSSQPEVVVAFGSPAQVADLYLTLRANKYTGLFATPVADQAEFISPIPSVLREGIYGVTTWPYSMETPDSSQFTRDYVATFGDVPTALSAAAYDTAVALVIAIGDAGVNPEQIRARIAALPAADSIQGMFNPKIGNNDLSASLSVIVTGRYGAPVVVARFNETGRLPRVSTPPTATPRPPTLTPIPSPTIVGVVCTPRNALNVRTGPGTNYPLISPQLRRGEAVQLIGASADFTWLVITHRQQQGWISASLCTIAGDVRSLPVVAAPPTPIPSPTPLPPTATVPPTPVPIADIVLVSASMNPPVPQPGVPFTLVVLVRNQGGANAGQFAVATSFKPGEIYTAQVVEGLGAGQETTVNLSNTVSGTTASATIAIVLDLNNQVNEGPNGEANNKPEFTYRVDRNRIAQGSVNLPPGNSADFQGGTADVSYDGTKLAPINGAKLGALVGTQVGQVHYDFLSPDKINNGVGIARADLVPGLVIGIYTAEGKRGALRVAGYSGDTIILEFFVYDA
ncbi:MAG: ABC transporter substrate-binding protein [Anaerolineae bacterium]|nr:ABC transporter substrate-binding protein [Anaerolineae bacterium]